MYTKYMCCTIKRKGEPPVVLMFSTNSGEIINLLYSYFQRYLLEEDYALTISNSRVELFKENFNYEIHEKSLSSITTNQVMEIYKNNRSLCKLGLPSSLDFTIAKR